MRLFLFLFLSPIMWTDIFAQSENSNPVTANRLSKIQENFIVVHSSNQEKIYGDSKTYLVDTNTYLVSVPIVSDTNQIVIELTLLSYSMRINSIYGASSLASYFYTTKNKIKNTNYQIAFDNLDATVGNLIGKKVQVIYLKQKDSLSIQNADSIVSSLKNIPSGLLQNIKGYFSNDYFYGFFNTFLRTGIRQLDTLGRKWTQLQEKETLGMMPNYADKNYTISAIKKDSVVLNVKGISTYRNPSWTTQFESKSYGGGVFDGQIILRPNNIFPYCLNLNLEFKFPKSRYSEFDEIVKTKAKIVFMKKQK
jgi:hypothetical protein